MFHFHLIHFLGLFANSYPPVYDFLKILVFRTLFLKISSYSQLFKYHKVQRGGNPSRNFSFSYKHAYIFVTSQPKIFVFVWPRFHSLFKAPQNTKVVSSGNRGS